MAYGRLKNRPSHLCYCIDGLTYVGHLVDLYHVALKIKLDCLCCLLFLGVNDLGVYLRGADVGMSQHL